VLIEREKPSQIEIGGDPTIRRLILCQHELAQIFDALSKQRDLMFYSGTAALQPLNIVGAHALSLHSLV
jgi:hypothetical protein